VAQKIVCDVCGNEIIPKDTEPVDYRKVRLLLTARIFTKNDWNPADICRVCLAGAALRNDDSPKPAQAKSPDPFGSLQYFVHKNGVRCPGPHGAFKSRSEAEAYLAGYGPGGEIRER
jgi:hypothetical protein